jgi:GTP:adenosylcobinamide-phosphate guanylyltransferase
MEQVDAILPAGGKLTPDFAEKVGTHSKALIQFDGETILGCTLRALQESGRVRRTVVIGSAEVLGHPDAQLATHRLPEAQTGPDNIFLGISAIESEPNPPKKVLIVTTDLPFLTGGVINNFLDQVPEGVDIAAPLVHKEEFLGRFPGGPSMFVRLRDGHVTLGCAYIADIQALRKAKPHIDKVFENRKSKMGMARLLGLGFVFKYLTNGLSVGDIEKKIESLLKIKGTAISGAPPELAFDIDYHEDFAYAEQHLNGS